MEKKNLVLSSAVEEYPLDENNGVDPYTDESEEVQKFDWGISCKTQVLVGVNPPSSLATEGDGLKGDSDDKGVVDDGETDGLLKGTDDLNECDFQTTPPDSEAFGNGHANEKGGKPPIESTQRIDTCVGRAFGNDYKEKKNDSISSFKSVRVTFVMHFFIPFQYIRIRKRSCLCTTFMFPFNLLCFVFMIISTSMYGNFPMMELKILRCYFIL